jgi:cell division protease FtsH
MQKISNCIYIFFLSLFVSANVISTTLYAAETEQTSQPQIPISVINEYLEAKLKPTLKLYEQLDFICEHLAQVINNHQVRNIDKKLVLQHITSIRKNIQEIKKGAYVVVDPYSIKVLLSIAEALIEHMRTIVGTGLKKLPELQLDQVIKRSLASDDFNFEHLEQQLETNENTLKQLDTEAQNVGLSFFNRSYRRLEKFISDYSLVKRGSVGLFLGLGIYWILSRIDKETTEKLPGFQKPDENSFIAKIKSFKENYIGTAPRYNKVTGDLVTKKDELKGGSAIESFFGGHGIVDLTMPALITWPLLAKPFENNWKEFKGWTAKKWEGIRSYLRGGPVEKKAEYWKREPRIRFNDIIGKNHHKNVLGRVVDYIRDHERYDRAGISPEAGYLLAGPSRTGKTYLAEAIAGEIKDVLLEKGVSDQFNFFAFNAADIAEFGIELIMNLAKDSAPCVLFIDEIDMCGWQRERDAKSLSQVLTAMSGCMNKDRSKTVIVIGATNKPQNLDQALLQKGRFGKILWFDYPTYEDRLAYLVRELENRSIMSIDENYIKKLAQETDRCSFDDLNSIIVTALQKSKAQGRILEAQHLEEAFDEEIRHVMLDEIPLPDEQKKILAVHQAGHTLATMLLDDAEFLTKVTIRPITNKVQEESVWSKYANDGKSKDDKPKEQIEYGKLFSSKPNHNDTIKTQQEILNMIRIELAGHIAEKVLLGSSGYTYHKEDKAKALHMAKYVVFEGMSERDLPKETCSALNTKAYSLLQACQDEVQELLEQHKDQLASIATALYEKLTLSQAELVELLQKKEETPKVQEELQTTNS